MNECVAGVFSFRKGHDRKFVEGAAGLYRVRAVWFFPVPEIPEGKQERIMCSRWGSFRRKHDRKFVTGAAGLYRDRAVWIFPVPEIPEGKHERIMCNRFFLRREA